MVCPLLLMAHPAAGGAARSQLAEAASEEPDAEVVRSLLNGARTSNERRPDRTTALHWAAKEDDLVTADLLIGPVHRSTSPTITA